MITETLSAPGLTLELEQRIAETIVHLTGTITAESAATFQNQIQTRLVSDPSSKFVLDLSRVTYVDSCGLAALLTVWTAGQRSNCNLKLANLSPRVERLFSITRLDHVFNTTTTSFSTAQTSVSQGASVPNTLRPLQLFLDKFMSVSTISGFLGCFARVSRLSYAEKA